MGVKRCQSYSVGLPSDAADDDDACIDADNDGDGMRVSSHC